MSRESYLIWVDGHAYKDRIWHDYKECMTQARDLALQTEQAVEVFQLTKSFRPERHIVEQE